mgnify:CR=1 FL=1
MISTLFIAKQVAFVRNYDVGLQKENIVVLPAKEQVLKSREAFVRELVGQPGVIDATFATGLPSRVEGRNFPEAKPVQEAPYFIVNQRAVEEMKLKRGSAVGARFSVKIRPADGPTSTVLKRIGDVF